MEINVNKQHKQTETNVKIFDFSKKPKIKKKIRRQFIVDGQFGFYRGTADESLPTPWFIENPQEKKETLTSPVTYKRPSIFDEEEDTQKLTKSLSVPSLSSNKATYLSPIRRRKIMNNNNNNNNNNVTFSTKPPTDWLGNFDNINKRNKLSSPSSDSPNISNIYNKVIKKNIPSYSMAGKYGFHEKSQNASPGPAYYPVTPSKYHRHMHKPQRAIFGSTKRSIIEQPIDQEQWMKRWRPKLHKWKTIDDISTNSPIISRHQPPLTLPQLRRYNLGGKDDLNSSLGGTFNNYLRPSTKRTSKIVKNEAYIVEARKNIWKSLRYQERMHLPGVVMKRLKYSKVKLSDRQRQIKKLKNEQQTTQKRRGRK